MKEARLYKRDGTKAECFLCSHRCSIPEGRNGVCSVRWNQAGTLYTAAYGNVIARHVDPIEKKPLYHFLPGSLSYSVATAGCNFRCSFCQNWQISQFRASEPVLPGEPLPVDEAVRQAAEARCSSIAYTYTEPTIFFEYALDIATKARAKGIRNVFVTNGYQTEEACQAMEGIIDASNVDLKSFRDAFYRRLCKARLEPVLETIRRMASGPMHLEVTTLVVPDENDDEAELKDIAGFLASLSPDIPWHVSRFHPDHESLDKPPTPEKTIRRALDIGQEAGLRYVYAGNLPGHDIDTRCHACGHPVVRRSYMGVRSLDLDGGRCPACGAEIPVVL